MSDRATSSAPANGVVIPDFDSVSIDTLREYVNGLAKSFKQIVEGPKCDVTGRTICPGETPTRTAELAIPSVIIEKSSLCSYADAWPGWTPDIPMFQSAALTTRHGVQLVGRKLAVIPDYKVERVAVFSDPGPGDSDNASPPMIPNVVSTDPVMIEFSDTGRGFGLILERQSASDGCKSNHASSRQAGRPVSSTRWSRATTRLSQGRARPSGWCSLAAIEIAASSDCKASIIILFHAMRCYSSNTIVNARSIANKDGQYC